MAIEIVPYEARHIPDVLACNSRLRAGDVNERYGIRGLLPETNVVPVRTPASGLRDEPFLAVDSDGVHGSYVLQHQDFQINGDVISIGLFRHPISEGIIDRRYALVGPRLLSDALERQPLLYGLGIGGREIAYARLLARARFRIEDVPFFVRIQHASRVFREVPLLRATRLRRLGSDVAATTGLGALGVGAVQTLLAARVGQGCRGSVHEFTSFDDWADVVWSASRETIDFSAVRTSAVLTELYEAPGNRFLKVAIEDHGKPCGWAVCLATQMNTNRHFGNLKVGSIVDCLARPGYEATLMKASVDRLRREKVDVVVTNQSLPVLDRARRAAGFMKGPSNFVFAASPALAARLYAGSRPPRINLNRGDGDGPVNL